MFSGARLTDGFGVNAEGDISGDFVDAAGANHGYVPSGGVFTQIDVPGSIFTNTVGINVDGHVVGRFDSADRRTHGYELRYGTFTPIDVPARCGPTPRLSTGATMLLGPTSPQTASHVPTFSPRTALRFRTCLQHR